MAYVLLWIESLAVSLLLVATVLACAARWSNRWLRAAVWLPVALLPLAVYAGLTVVSGLLMGSQLGIRRWFAVALTLALSYAAGVVLLRVFAFSRLPEAPSTLRAAGWPRAKLLGVLLLALAVHMMTFWNLDLSIRQSLTGLRAEAGALALSVAPARVPDRENAAWQYQQAFEVLGPRESWPEAARSWLDRTQRLEDVFDANDPALRPFLKEKQPVLVLLHQAAEKPGCYFDRDYGHPSIYTLLPELQDIRNAARLLALDARVEAADGNLRSAVRNVHTMFAMGEHIGSGPFLVSMLVAIAIDTMAFDTLGAIAAAGSPAGEDLDDVSFSGSFSYHRTYQRALRMEEALVASVFCDVAAGRLSVAELLGNGAEPGLLLLPSFSYRVFLLADDIAAQERFMRRSRELATRPYHETRIELGELEERIRSKPGGFLTAELMPPVSRATEAGARGDAQRRVAQMALASLRYRAREGRLPQSGKELVPEFLPYMPQDPFDGSPIKMKPTGDGLTIYSIGPNAADDGGTVAEDPHLGGDIALVLPR